MRKRAITFSLVMFLLVCGGCTAGEKSAEPTPVAPAFETGISYGQGFSEMERGPDGSTWRWMDTEGAIMLKNTRRDMVLRIKGGVPIDRFPQPPTFRIQFNGELLEEITAAPAVLEKEYAIPAAKQSSGDWSELRISTNQSFVPKEVDKSSTDARRLGFSLHKLEWVTK